MDGIIVINKPKEYTSHDVVAKVRKLLKIKKVGHTGTLDPNATGVLPLLLGESTKLSQFLIEHDKEYEVILKLGIKTDTADGEGKIVEEQKVIMQNKKNIEEVLETIKGKQKQIPPMYSAIKVKGKKLYEYAREGKQIEIEPREIEVYEIELIEIKEEEISFKVHCSKGTYIRSLCEKIAEKLGTIGYMKELNRTKVGKFRIENSVTIEELEINKENEEWLRKNVITMQMFFKDKPIIELEEQKLKHFLNGVKITCKEEAGIYNIYCNQRYIGIGKLENNLLKREITQFI